MSNDIRTNRSTLTAVILFATVVVLVGWDLWIDFGEGVGWVHIIVESFIFLVAIAGTVIMWRQLDRTKTDLEGAIVEAEHWKQENQDLLQGLSAAIEKQFSRWKLSEAEADVGLLLLKGLGHKEIAAFW